MTVRGFVLDAGAFLAIERGQHRIKALMDDARRAGAPLVTSAGVVAQVWRGGASKQVPLTLIARTRGWPVLTSDPDDLHALDRSLDLYRI